MERDVQNARFDDENLAARMKPCGQRIKVPGSNGSDVVDPIRQSLLTGADPQALSALTVQRKDERQALPNAFACRQTEFALSY